MRVRSHPVAARARRQFNARAPDAVRVLDDEPRVRLEEAEEEVLDELLFQVVDVDLVRSCGKGLVADRVELVPLAEVGGEGHGARLAPYPPVAAR